MTQAFVWAVQHEQCEGLGTIADALAQAGYRDHPVRAFAGDPIPSEPGDAGGIVVMGGPMGVYDHPRLPYLRSEMRLIEQTLKRGLPVLGVCLGSQLLAQVLGSDVRPSGYQEIGWYPVTLQPAATREPAWATLPRRFHAFHWHGDAFDLPPGTELLASSDLCPVQAFRAAGSAWGIQFHLEVTAPMVEQMLATWPEELAAAGLRGEEIARASHSHLPGMREVARKVFAGWAAGLA